MGERSGTGTRVLRQQCPTCQGKALVLAPRFGLSTDGTAGTVHVQERCPDCAGASWLDRGSVRLA